MVDPWAPEPLYQQLAALLRSKIKDGTYAPGAKLPSESTLQQEHGLARDTVRQALDMLRNENLIVTFTGRGSFVRPDYDGT